MAQIKNKFDIRDSIADEGLVLRRHLPNFFDKNDEVNLFTSLGGSLVLHFVVGFTFWLLVTLGIAFPRLAMPELPNRDIEFKLVQNESKPPINKNTKIRSDRDSQAGGKHDPKKAISDPTPKGLKPAKASAPAKAQVKKQVQQKPAQPAKAQPKQAPKAVQKIVQQVQKPQVKQQTKPQAKPQTVQKPSPAKPAALKAPTTALKPAIKPSNQGVAKPSAPKIATAPKSPFAVPVPSGAPSGSTYKPAGSPTGGSSSGSGSKGTGVPAPKFSSSGGKGGTSGGSSGGSSRPSGGSYGSRGSYGGGGSGGNPSPGNPKGAPGIDAVKQPNWGPYMRDLEQRIKRNWTPPKGDSSKRVIITFTISRDGRLLNKRIVKSSGVPLADRAAMSAIEQTAPFRPLPPEFKGQSVPIEFTFDYNVLNSVMR